MWNTRETPVAIDRQSGEPAESGLVLAPPKGGTRIRVIDFPPEGEAIRRLTAAEAAAKFGEMGGAEAARSSAGAPHPLMHRTQTLDYGIVLEGELTLVVDRGETTVRAGDIVIQRGTNHAWANRSDTELPRRLRPDRWPVRRRTAGPDARRHRCACRRWPQTP